MSVVGRALPVAGTPLTKPVGADYYATAADRVSSAGPGRAKLGIRHCEYSRHYDSLPGTDAGVSQGKPHDVLPHALRALVEQIGMTPLQALRAATTIAACAIGLGGTKGRIAAGADADLLVVRGDPVADIGSMTNVQAVFRAGLRAR